jgi:hypothetical protein
LPSCSVNPWYVRGDDPVAPEPRLSRANYFTDRSDCLEKYEWDQSVGLGLESPKYRDEPAITVLSGRPMADPPPPMFLVVLSRPTLAESLFASPQDCFPIGLEGRGTEFGNS